VNDLESEFKQHKRYSESIRRLKKRHQPKFGGKNGQLPPIEDEEVLSNSRSPRKKETISVS